MKTILIIVILFTKFILRIVFSIVSLLFHQSLLQNLKCFTVLNKNYLMFSFTMLITTKIIYTTLN